MMNRTMQLNQSAALTLCPVSALSSFAYHAASFFSALRFYFYYYYYYVCPHPSERKLIFQA